MTEHKVVQYTILSTSNMNDLIYNVNQMLKMGFVLYGTPYTVDHSSGTYSTMYHYQAMVKYEETTPTVVKVDGTGHLSEIG